jgi:hypothetical protein
MISTAVLFLLFVYSSSFAAPPILIVGGELTEQEQKRADELSQARKEAEGELCSRVLRVEVRGEAPALIGRSIINQTVPAPARRGFVPWFRRFLGIGDFKSNAPVKTEQEVLFNSFLGYWSNVIKGIESTQNLRFNPDFYRDYWIHEYGTPVAEWKKFALVQFFNQEGQVVYYFFSESLTEKPEDAVYSRRESVRSSGQILHKSDGALHVHNGYSFGSLDKLRLSTLRSMIAEDVSDEDIDIDLVRRVGHYDDSSTNEYVLSQERFYYHHRWIGTVSEVLLPLTESTSLKVVRGQDHNTITVVEADNTAIFTRALPKKSPVLEKLYKTWKLTIESGGDPSDITSFYEEVDLKVTKIFDEINEDMSLTDLQIRVRQLSEQYQNLVKQITHFSMTGMELEVVQSFSSTRLGDLDVTQAQEMLAKIQKLIEFKGFHLSQLQRLLESFETQMALSYDLIMRVMENSPESSDRSVAITSFEDSFGSSVREAVALNFEATHILEQQRLQRIIELSKKIQQLSSISPEDLQQLMRDLKVIFSVDEEGVLGPMDIEINLPILEFIYLLQYDRAFRSSGGRMMMII